MEAIKKSVVELQALLTMIQQDISSSLADDANNSSQSAKPDDDIIDAEVTAA